MWLSSKNSCSVRNSDSNLDISDLEAIDDDAVDPRVQEELERLNNATDVINKLEVELDDSRAAFRQLLCDSTQRINSLAKKLGSCIEKARPYYDARMKEKSAHTEAQKAALRFEKANSAHAAAKEMVFLAEEGLQKDGRTFDPVWQEMLNHATMKVNEAESERLSSEQEHKRISRVYTEAEKQVHELKKDLKKNIIKSSLSTRRNLLQIVDLAHQHQLLLLPYFEMKAQLNKLMEEQKKAVQELEENVLRAKQSYADALHNLEEISDEIHQRRKLREQRLALGARGSGVGAEHPEPSLQPETSVGTSANLEDYNETFLDLPLQLRLPKSLSSSTLSELRLTTKRLSSPIETAVNRSYARLRKSKSVVDRTEAGPLFGRFSIAKNHRLQVDIGSQTDEVVCKPSSLRLTSPKAPNVAIAVLPTGATSQNRDRLDIPNEKGNSTPSSQSTSVQSSETNSPTGGTAVGSVVRRHHSLSTGDEGEMSDTESLASIDCLTDDQIASLMLDKELNEVVQNLNWKMRLQDRIEGVQHANHQTTQTAEGPCNESSAVAVTTATDHDSSEDEITLSASTASDTQSYGEVHTKSTNKN